MTDRTPTQLSYALVTPARNERENLDRLAESVFAQEQRPAAWVIVDDGSDDGTSELAHVLARETPWITVLQRQTDRGGTLSSGRREGRALDAFRTGVRTLAEPVDIVVKLDADTSFDPWYFRGIVDAFQAQPDLGIAGGACYELQDGEWRRQKVVDTHPRGASRAYRWELVEDVMELESRMGWDGLDEIKARMRGYRTATLRDLGFRHHRATGARERGRLRHQAAQGRAAWYMGYRPTYLLMRTIYRGLREPSAVGMVLGYARAAVSGSPRCPDRRAVAMIREDQRLRRVVARGAPQ